MRIFTKTAIVFASIEDGVNLLVADGDHSELHGQFLGSFSPEDAEDDEREVHDAMQADLELVLEAAEQVDRADFMEAIKYGAVLVVIEGD